MRDILSKNEWYIMEALWENPPKVLSEIVESTQGELNWDPNTFGTYIARLVKKGFIRAEKMRGSRSFQYYPAISRRQCVLSESKHMREKMSTDNAMLFMAYMMKESGLTEKNTEELKELIDSLSTNFDNDEE